MTVSAKAFLVVEHKSLIWPFESYKEKESFENFYEILIFASNIDSL